MIFSVWVQRSCLQIVIFLFGFNVHACKVTYFWVTCFGIVILLSGFMFANYDTSVGLMLSKCDTGIIRRLGYQINEFTRLPLFLWTGYFLVRILASTRSMYSHAFPFNVHCLFPGSHFGACEINVFTPLLRTASAPRHPMISWKRFSDLI